MKEQPRRIGSILALCAALAASAAGCENMQFGRAARAQPGAADSPRAATQTLTGAAEVPPVATSASGRGNIAVRPDGSVTGSVVVSGMTPTMAHIHVGPAGSNGPVIVPLERTSDNTFSVPAGARLTEAQQESYRTGSLYVNVHSAAHPGGEVRAQLNR